MTNIHREVKIVGHMTSLFKKVQIIQIKTLKEMEKRLDLNLGIELSKVEIKKIACQIDATTEERDMDLRKRKMEKMDKKMELEIDLSKVKTNKMRCQIDATTEERELDVREKETELRTVSTSEHFQKIRFYNGLELSK